MRSKMMSLIFCLSILLSSFAQAAVFPGGPSITVGGYNFPNSGNLITLYCSGQGNDTTTANCTFRQSAGTAGYTPSGSKAFHAVGMQGTSITATANTFTYYISSNDVGVNTNTAPTGVVYPGGSGGLSYGCASSASIGAQCQMAIDLVVPNTKYLTMTMQSIGYGVIQVWGYEQ